MSNWFENNAAKSVIGYTLIVIAATWGFFTFIVEQRKIDLAKAETENYKSQAEQLNAKVSILEMQITSLKGERDFYLETLKSSPDTIPTLKKSLEETKQENIRLVEQLRSAGIKNTLYSVTETISKGSSYIDEKTGAIVGIIDINSDNNATVSLEFPGKPRSSVEKVTAGQSWTFQSRDRQFRLVITDVKWIGSQAKVRIDEIPSQ
jgi:hypothetical protein